MQCGIRLPSVTFALVVTVSQQSAGYGHNQCGYQCGIQASTGRFTDIQYLVNITSTTDTYHGPSQVGTLYSPVGRHAGFIPCCYNNITPGRGLACYRWL